MSDGVIEALMLKKVDEIKSEVIGVLRAENAKLRAWIEGRRIPHCKYSDTDPENEWCTSLQEPSGPCNCGADSENAAIDDLLGKP